MADFKVQINSITGGIASHWSEVAEDQYIFANGIDPEGILVANQFPTIGICPTPVQDFGALLSSAPTHIISPGRDSNVYVYGSNGQVTRYDNTFSTETLLSSSLGNVSFDGAAYYNNYLYFATSSDVHRYGPLDGTPAMTLSAYSAGATRPLSATVALPSTGNLTYTRHAMHVHNDNKLYVADYISGAAATPYERPCVSYISSLGRGGLPGYVSDALDLPGGYLITDIESFGNDLAILAVPYGKYASGAIPRTGRPALFLWDTFSSSFYRQIDIPDPLATAMYNHNGELRIFAGNVNEYTRILGYTGGNSFASLAYLYGQSPPGTGGVDARGNLLGFVGSTSTFYSMGVYSYGMRNPSIGQGSVNMLATAANPTGSNITATSVAFIGTASAGKNPVFGWASNTTWGLSRLGNSLGSNTTIFLRPIQIGQEFEVTKIRVPLKYPIVAGTGINVIAYTDSAQLTTTLATINSSTYGLGTQIVDITVPFKANTDFALKFEWSGTDPTPIMLPITIWGRTLKDMQ